MPTSLGRSSKILLVRRLAAFFGNWPFSTSMSMSARRGGRWGRGGVKPASIPKQQEYISTKTHESLLKPIWNILCLKDQSTT